MLHLLMEKGPWFRAKSFGFGSGWPFKWQGWALMAAHVGVLAGIAATLQDRQQVMIAVLVIATLAPMPIYAARTEGGWRWRWR